MRIWDIPVECLCRNHLLAEHRELHAIWSIIINEKDGYRNHPEVMRWHGRLVALWERHERQRMEMGRRGYAHKSPLDLKAIPWRHKGRERAVSLDSPECQREMLRDKGCSCNVSGARKSSSQTDR
ncbi:MAG: pyrimidine dimer DNA glycosylase [Methanobacteriota archaeon]|nr:MAG: pyrimidine dimer DNA glycosylase [Euryarchaeota archaeon]